MTVPSLREERICRILAGFRGEGFLLEIAKLGCGGES